MWGKAHLVVLDVYRLTKRFPSGERYGLVSQMRRAGSSVCANIAEGCGRGTRPDFSRYVQIALGSASELEYHLILAGDLSLVDSKTNPRLIGSVSEVKRMLTGLLRRLKAG